MNIETLLHSINKRPGMFVQDRRLDYIRYFIAGFYCHASVSGTTESIDRYFNDNFHGWVREWLGNNLNIEFDEERGWYEYITLSTPNNDDSFNLFFKLVNEFFKEFHEANK